MSIDTAAPEIRRLKEVGMKLISLDTQFDGTVVEILGYRAGPTAVEITAILDSPGAWYSRSYPVVVDAHNLNLLLTVHSTSRAVTHRARKDRP